MSTRIDRTGTVNFGDASISVVQLPNALVDPRFRHCQSCLTSRRLSRIILHFCFRVLVKQDIGLWMHPNFRNIKSVFRGPAKRSRWIHPDAVVTIASNGKYRFIHGRYQISKRYRSMIRSSTACTSSVEADDVQTAQVPMQPSAISLLCINGIFFDPSVRAFVSCLMCRIYSFVDHGSIAILCVSQKVWVPGFFGKRRTLAQRKDAAVLASGLGKIVHIDDVALICINGCSSHFLASGCQEEIVA
jgi:hypothetical protein